MEMYADLKPEQRRFIHLANKNGYVDKISRKEIHLLKRTYGLKHPYFITGGKGKYRIGVGLYRLLGIHTNEDWYREQQDWYLELRKKDKVIPTATAIEKMFEQDNFYKEIKQTTLSDKEIDVLSMRFGILIGETMTLVEIGKSLGLTRERIRQIEKNALVKLNKNPLSSKEVMQLFKSSLISD